MPLRVLPGGRGDRARDARRAARLAVPDCTVTMTHSGYWPRQSSAHGVFDKSMSSTAGDFRRLTPLVLMAALRQAGTTVYEPLHRFELEFPADTLGAVLPALGAAGRRPGDAGPGAMCACWRHDPRRERPRPAAAAAEADARRGRAGVRFDRYEVTGWSSTV